MSEPLPPVDSLRCFVEAARVLNFRAAAAAVGLTPAALGQRIRQLEELWDTRLFHRTTRSVTLTEAGLALLPYAREALGALAACARAGRGELGPAAMDITLGTRHELGLSWIVPMLGRLRAIRPGLTIHLYVGSGPDLLHRVRALRCDCAVTSTALTDPKLDAIRLHEERYALVAAPSLLMERPLDSFADASRHTLIDIGAELPLYGYWRAADGAEPLEFERIVYMGTIAAIRELALAGEGVAVLPRYFVEPDLEAGRLEVALPDIEPRPDFFRLVFRADDPHRSLYEALAEVMRAAPLV